MKKSHYSKMHQHFRQMQRPIDSYLLPKVEALLGVPHRQRFRRHVCNA